MILSRSNKIHSQLRLTCTIINKVITGSRTMQEPSMSVNRP